MAEVNYGRIALLPKGDFFGDVQYEVGDVVSYRGSSYMAKEKPPIATLPTEEQYWQVCAKGSQYVYLNITSDEYKKRLLEYEKDPLYTDPETGTLFSETLYNITDDYEKLERYAEGIKYVDTYEIDKDNVQGAIDDIIKKINSLKLDNPIGHIISYMGVSAPEHYLSCDGAEYNISDFPYLSKHFIDNFGTANYFGGDGVTTFAVPDLRGEFLRGTGTATRDTGSGADVGRHQEPTKITNASLETNSIAFYNNSSSPEKNTVQNQDKIYLNSTNYVNFIGTSYQGVGMCITSARPTNTSVLYCIKYEPAF